MSRSKGASTGHFLSAQPSRPKKTWAYLCIDLISDRAVLFLVPLRITFDYRGLRVEPNRSRSMMSAMAL